MRKMSIGENHVGKLTPMRSNISRFSRGIVATHTVSAASSAMWAEQFPGDISIRANGMRTRAQRLSHTPGGRVTLGREGHRNVQNFPRFGRGFVLRGDRKNEEGIISIENQCTLRGN